MIEAFMARWGYLAVGLGTFIEGETVLLAAGALARNGVFSPFLALGSGIAGSCAWSQLWFHSGRRIGRHAIQRRPSWSARASEIERFMIHQGPPFVVAFRFVIGMGTVCPAVLGASGYPTQRFLLLDTLGAVLWATGFGGLGWGLAAGLGHALGRNTRIPELLTAAATTGALLWLGTKLAAYCLRHRTEVAE